MAEDRAGGRQRAARALGRPRRGRPARPCTAIPSVAEVSGQQGAAPGRTPDALNPLRAINSRQLWSVCLHVAPHQLAASDTSSISPDEFGQSEARIQDEAKSRISPDPIEVSLMPERSHRHP